MESVRTSSPLECVGRAPMSLAVARCARARSSSLVARTAQRPLAHKSTMGLRHARARPKFGALFFTAQSVLGWFVCLHLRSEWTPKLAPESLNAHLKRRTECVSKVLEVALSVNPMRTLTDLVASTCGAQRPVRRRPQVRSLVSRT